MAAILIIFLRINQPNLMQFIVGLLKPWGLGHGLVGLCFNTALSAGRKSVSYFFICILLSVYLPGR